jgi:hypothetical protein
MDDVDKLDDRDCRELLRLVEISRKIAIIKGNGDDIDKWNRLIAKLKALEMTLWQLKI